MSNRMSRGEKMGAGAFIGVWVAVVLGNLAFWGVVIWAIIKLVNHYA